MLLTLAIPTYNRAESLRNTLLSFIAQIKQEGLRDIEIVISDNCSTDSTPDVCASVKSEHPDINLRFFRNESNLGFDGNVNALFSRASGRYVWTFSDDDLPARDALAHLVELLRAREVCFAFVNYEVRVDGRPIASRFGNGADRWLEARDLLKTIRFSNSLISSCVFRRDAWLAVDADKFVGTLWIHFFMAREILQTGEGLIVGRPLFTMIQSGLEKSRAEKQREDSKGIEYYMAAHLKFLEFASELRRYDFDRNTLALAHTLGQRDDIFQVVNFKLAVPMYTIAQLTATWRQMAKFRRCDPRFWTIVTPVLFAPSWPLRLARLAYRKLKRCRC